MRRNTLARRFLLGVCIIGGYQVLYLMWSFPSSTTKLKRREQFDHFHEDHPPGSWRPDAHTVTSGNEDMPIVNDMKSIVSNTHLQDGPHCDRKPFESDGASYLGRLQRQMRSWHWTWISGRISNLWPYWSNATKTLSKEEHMQNRHRLKILMVPGVLTETHYAKPRCIKEGCPLGDLQQWADLIAAAHVLGHEIKLMVNILQASIHLSSLASAPSCDQYDLVFGDYSVLNKFEENIFQKYKCRLRLVDAYGTEPAYNHHDYFKSKMLKSMQSALGKLSLNPKQIYTFYPHTPDNSFLGFVVPPIQHNNNHTRTKRENKALLYGKTAQYFKHMRPMISKILEHMEVHATTLHKGAYLPKEVINHKIMKSADYRALMEKIKVLVAAGNPCESTGAMEAVARGMVFLQPVFKGMQKQTILKGKPTTRQLTSQVPYLEHVIGRPHVYTIDYDDEEQMDATLKEIISNEQLEPFLPREFSMEGMLERLAVLFEKQDFCLPGPPKWPPLSALQTRLSTAGDDCIQTCQDKGLVCEPVYFHHINSSGFESMKSKCSNISEEEDIYYPAFDASSGRCISQADPLLFSCAGHKENIIRICPCRDYIPYQISLCKDCLKTRIDENNPSKNKGFVDKLNDVKQRIFG